MKYPVMSGLAFTRQIAEVNEIHLYMSNKLVILSEVVTFPSAVRLQSVISCNFLFCEFVKIKLVFLFRCCL